MLGQTSPSVKSLAPYTVLSCDLLINGLFELLAQKLIGNKFMHILVLQKQQTILQYFCYKHSWMLSESFLPVNLNIFLLFPHFTNLLWNAKN
jgi:hypothetical protein